LEFGSFQLEAFGWKEDWISQTFFHWLKNRFWERSRSFNQGRIKTFWVGPNPLTWKPKVVRRKFYGTFLTWRLKKKRGPNKKNQTKGVKLGSQFLGEIGPLFILGLFKKRDLWVILWKPLGFGKERLNSWVGGIWGNSFG